MASKKQTAFSIITALGIAFFLMLFLTRSSFLYPYNNWDDSNSYFSMGKSMFHGTLIYRDLFDQKGPYLYFLYGLCSLISRTTFHGVFLMEVIWAAADLLLLQKIMRLFCRKNIALILSPILLSYMFASKSFYWGGCAEELCLPFLLYPLYLLLDTLKGSTSSYIPQDASSGSSYPESAHDFAPAHAAKARTAHFAARTVFLAGLCCGFVFCVKFTLMGFFLGFAIIVILTCRSAGEFFRLAGAYLAGIVIPFIPWLVYFGITGGLDDWYRVYIYTNVFLYSDFGANSHGASVGQKIYDLAKILYWLVLDNIQYYVFIILGMLWFLIRKGTSRLMRFLPVLLFGCTFLFIYIGGAHLPYYALPLTVFAVLGMSGIGHLLEIIFTAKASNTSSNSEAQQEANSDDIDDANEELLELLQAEQEDSAVCTNSEASIQPSNIEKKDPTNQPKQANHFLKKACIVILLLISCRKSLRIFSRFSWNADYLGVSRDQVFLSKFTEDINNDRAAGLVDAENTTLLNIGCLDAGLYNAADIYPTCYWFQTQTLPGDEVTDSQLSYITDGLVDYVLARDTYPDEIWDNYELIDTFHQELMPQAFDYYLFRKKS